MNEKTSITFANLTFVGSRSNSSALLTNYGTLTLINSIASDNTTASGYGGGIDNGGSLTLINSAVSNNTIIGFGGGGIENTGSLTLKNSVVSGNTLNGGVGGDGGGIENSGSLILTNSTISNNTAAFDGGGIANGGSLTLIESTISDNTASQTDGGSIENIASPTTANITKVPVGATPPSVGGIVGGNLTLMNSTISGNTASQGNGGGIGNFGGTVTLVFCTLYGNNANRGGGLSTDDNSFSPPLTIPGTSIISNSLVAGNQAPTNPDIAGKLTTKGYNLLQSTTGVVFLDPDHKHNIDLINISLTDIKIDPSLQLNGSTTTKTHALRPGRPAIDIIPLTFCHIVVNNVLITTDQRGVKRPQGLACDIGAYEYKG